MIYIGELKLILNKNNIWNLKIANSNVGSLNDVVLTSISYTEEVTVTKIIHYD